jgi:hypothetical protein
MDKNVENQVEETKVEETGAETQTAEKKEDAEVKLLTQEEFDKAFQERLAREKKKLPSKEEMDKFKEWQESQKTEAQKRADEMVEIEKVKAENELLKSEKKLSQKGIKEKDYDYVLFKVSKMEGEFDTNLEAFIKDNPEFLTKDTTTTGIKTFGSVSSVEKGVDAILKARHPEIF